MKHIVRLWISKHFVLDWVDVLKEMVNDKKIRKLFAYANNHYEGFGPGTVKRFVELWKKK